MDRCPNCRYTDRSYRKNTSPCSECLYRTRMSNYQANRIRKQRGGKYARKSEIPLKPKFVVGFDSEQDTTSDGRPMLFQFSLPKTNEEDTLLVTIPEKEHAGLRAF